MRLFRYLLILTALAWGAAYAQSVPVSALPTPNSRIVHITQNGLTLISPVLKGKSKSRPFRWRGHGRQDGSVTLLILIAAVLYFLVYKRKS